MADLRVLNEAGGALDHYVLFTLPSAVAATIGDYGELGTGEVAEMVMDDGLQPLYAVRKSWASGTSNHVLTALGSNPGYTFTLHSGFGTTGCGIPDTLDPGVVPIVRLVKADGSRVIVNPGNRSQSPINRFSAGRAVRRVWDHHDQGYHTYTWQTFFHDHAIAEGGVSFHWSDERVPEWTVDAVAIEFEFGFEIKPIFQSAEVWTLSNGNKTARLELDWADAGGSGNDRLGWGNRLWHGRAIHLRFFMFAEAGLSSGTDWLECTASPDDWDGGWGWSGRVPVEPQNTDVSRPDYTQAIRHYFSVDRSSGGSDLVGSTGQCLHRYTHDQGLQGGFNYAPLPTAIYGDQPLKDAVFACADWAMRPFWTYHDGSYPQPGALATTVVLYSSFPHSPGDRPGFNSSFSAWFGAKRDYSAAVMMPPVSGDTAKDGWDLQHYSLSTPNLVYMLTKDEGARWILDNMLRNARIESRRGIWSGSGTGGHREFGRFANAMLQCKACYAEAEPIVREILLPAMTATSISNSHSTRYNSGAGQTGPSLIYGGEGGSVSTALPNINFGLDPLWNSFGVVVLHMIAEELGEGATGTYRTHFERFAQAILLHQTSNDGTGWTIPYDMRGSADGSVVPESWRISGHANYATVIVSQGGLALQRWGSHLAYLYSVVGQNAQARARAQQVLVKLRGSGETQPFGWLASALEAGAA